jgi:hypothetical protein
MLKAVMLCVFAPAGATGAGALLQQLLVSLWPGVQTIAVLGVSLDSYFGTAAIAALCIWVAVLIRRSAPGRGLRVASFFFPVLWLILLLAMRRPPNHLTGILRALFLASAIAPLLSLMVVYALPSNNRWGV